MSQETRQPNRVRELRENRLMTQAQLARKAKVALRTIHSVEKGMNCRMDTKRKILLALGMRFEDKEYVFPGMGRPSAMPFAAPVNGGQSGYGGNEGGHGGTNGGGMSGGGNDGGNDGDMGGGTPGGTPGGGTPFSH
jgi:DNA-binding XRE family transcriptional regulator